MKEFVNFYMMIGLPGSGKSTIASEYATKFNAVVLSSDAIRKELFNDESSQQDNGKVFSIMNSRAVENICSGINVIYDACNVSRKSRQTILSTIKNMINVHKIAVVVATPYSICIKRDWNRDRTVSEAVIRKFLNQFEFPFFGEGFDSIVIEKVDSANLISYFTAYEKMSGFDQKNPHHSLDLKSHCDKCQDYVLAKNTEFDVEPELAMAALLHDYGKLYTASWDEDKQCNHYFSHENVGAYRLLTEVAFPDWLDINKIIFYINYHMLPYSIRSMKETKKIKIKETFEKDKFLWDSLMLLHEGDNYAH